MDALLSQRTLHPWRNRIAARNDEREDRGAAMVEFAIVAIILVLFLFGIIEGGLLFRSKLALANSADEGVRRGSIEGKHPFADFEILQQVKRHSINPNAITAVVVYKAATPTSPPPAACLLASSSTDFCNHYVATDMNRSQGDFGSCGSLDGSWCPTDRDDTLGTGDFIGVWISGHFDSPSGALGSIDLKELSILPIESRGL